MMQAHYHSDDEDRVTYENSDEKFTFLNNTKISNSFNLDGSHNDHLGPIAKFKAFRNQHTDKSFANSNVSFDFEVASDDIDPDGDRDGYYEWNYEMKKADTEVDAKEITPPVLQQQTPMPLLPPQSPCSMLGSIKTERKDTLDRPSHWNSGSKRTSRQLKSDSAPKSAIKKQPSFPTSAFSKLPSAKKNASSSFQPNWLTTNKLSLSKDRNVIRNLEEIFEVNSEAIVSHHPTSGDTKIELLGSGGDSNGVGGVVGKKVHKTTSTKAGSIKWRLMKIIRDHENAHNWLQNNRNNETTATTADTSIGLENPKNRYFFYMEAQIVNCLGETNLFRYVTLQMEQTIINDQKRKHIANNLLLVGGENSIGNDFTTTAMIVNDEESNDTNNNSSNSLVIALFRTDSCNHHKLIPSIRIRIYDPIEITITPTVYHSFGLNNMIISDDNDEITRRNNQIHKLLLCPGFIENIY